MNALRANTTPLSIQIGLARFTGDLYVPSSARGLVLFVHGSGSTSKSNFHLKEGYAFKDNLTPKSFNFGTCKAVK